MISLKTRFGSHLNHWVFINAMVVQFTSALRWFSWYVVITQSAISNFNSLKGFLLDTILSSTHTTSSKENPSVLAYLSSSCCISAWCPSISWDFPSSTSFRNVKQWSDNWIRRWRRHLLWTFLLDCFSLVCWWSYKLTFQMQYLLMT